MNFRGKVAEIAVRDSAVKFGFDFDEPPTAKEVFEIAAVAKQAGWTIDQQQLEESTGYTLVRDKMRNWK